MTRKVLLFLLSSVLLMALLSSCGGDSSSVTPTTPTASSQFSFIRGDAKDLPPAGSPGTEPGIIAGPIDVYAMSNNGAPGSERKITSAQASIQSTQLSADGKKGVFVALTCCVNGVTYWQVFAVQTANPGNPVQLTFDAANHVSAEMSADGSKVVYLVQPPGEDMSCCSAYVVSSSGGTPSQVAVPNIVILNAAFTPSNKLILSAKNQWNGDWDGASIYRVNLDGSGLARLTENATDLVPSVSQDGSKIVFQRQNLSSGQWDIWIMDSNGQNARQLTGDGVSFDPLFVNDKIVFWADLDHDGDLDMYSMNFDGSGVTQLTDTAQPDIFNGLFV